MNAAEKQERARLHNAIRARISLIATERGLPKSETKKAMGRLLTRDVMRFAKKHRVNMDWLICGGAHTPLLSYTKLEVGQRNGALRNSMACWLLSRLRASCCPHARMSVQIGAERFGRVRKACYASR
jgi:hypothetical protein